MTYREKYFSLNKLNSKYLNRTVIKELLCDVGGFTDFLSLLQHFDEQILQEKKLDLYVDKVLNGEPYQYVIGKAFFINSFYKVTPDVLIPRQETEQLAIGAYTYINKCLNNKEHLSICDLCTGSGILAIFLKEKFPKSDVVASDISEKALEIAKENAQNHGILINFVQGDSVAPILKLKNRFDVLICNPPYIKNKETVDPQVLKFEPHLALFANPQIKFYEDVISNTEILMKKDYLIAFEIEEDMQKALTELIETKLPGVFYLFNKDIYNKTRFLYIIKKEDKTNA